MVRLIKRARRIKYQILCQIATSSHPLPVPVLIRDLSLGGLGIEVGRPLEKNEIINISVFLPLSKKFLNSRALVMRCHKDSIAYTAGLKFIEMKWREKFHFWKEMRWLSRNVEKIFSSPAHPVTKEEERLREFMENEIKIVPQVKENKVHSPRAMRTKYPITVWIGLPNAPLPIAGFIQDVSLTGLGLKSRHSISRDEVVNLSFFLPVSRSFLNVKGIVTRCEKVGEDWAWGVSFTGLDEKTKSLIWAEVTRIEL